MSCPLVGLVSRDFYGHKKKVHSVDWSAGVEQLAWHPTAAPELATASSDRSVRLWDVRQGGGKSTHTLSTSGENINVAWSGDGTLLAVGNKSDLLTFFDVRTQRELFTKQFSYQVNEFAWSANGELFFLTTDSGAVEVVGYPDFEPVRTLNGHVAIVYCLAQSSRYLACGSADALVSLWSLDEFACVRTFARLEWPVRTLSFSHDSRYLASASEDLVIDISDVESGDRVASVPTNCAMNSIAWCPKRHLLAYAGDEKDRSGYDNGAVHVFGFKK